MSPVLGKSPVMWLSLLLCLLPVCVCNYSGNDMVNHYIYGEDLGEILHEKALVRTIQAQGYGKLVVFSTRFCDVCELFEETLNNLLGRIRRWRPLLNEYFFDCTREYNQETCKMFEVRHAPVLRYFGPQYNKVRDTIGIDVTGEEFKEISSNLALQLSVGKFSLKTNFTVPNFQPLKYKELESIFAGNPKPEMVVFIYQLDHSTVGLEVALDLMLYEDIRVRIVRDKSIIGDYAPETEDSTIFVVYRNGKKEMLKGDLWNSYSYTKEVERLLLKKKHSLISEPLFMTIRGDSTYRYERGKDEIGRHVRSQRARVYRADLELAVQTLLYTEIPRAKIIEGAKFEVLHKFLTVLEKINPLNRQGIFLITHLNNVVGKIKSKKITAVQFLRQINIMGLPSRVFKSRHYVGCIASRPFLREYLCSLWTLFHYFTVNGARYPRPFRAGYIVEVIHGMVQHFLYECPYCSDRYLVLKNNLTHVPIKTHDDEIHLMWVLHNVFNLELRLSPTEDPLFPKAQFPSSVICQNCVVNGIWQTGNVMSYLKEFYDQRHLSFFGMATARGYTIH